LRVFILLSSSTGKISPQGHKGFAKRARVFPLQHSSLLQGLQFFMKEYPLAEALEALLGNHSSDIVLLIAFGLYWIKF
jgi:hypothetical protein